MFLRQTKRVERKNLLNTRRNLRYTRGDWLLICGPSAAALLPPGVATFAVTEAIWAALAQRQNLSQLRQTLSGLGADGYSNQALLSWDSDHVHIMLRGEINVVDSQSGQVVASGVRDEWFETSLDEPLLAFKLGSETGFEVPLAAGAAFVSSFSVGFRKHTPAGFEATEVLDLIAPYAPDQETVEQSPLGTFNEVDNLFQAAWKPNPSLGAGWDTDATKQPVTEPKPEPIQPVISNADDHPIAEPIQSVDVSHEDHLVEIPAVSASGFEEEPEKEAEIFYDEAPVAAQEPVMPAPAEPKPKVFVLRAPDGVHHVLEHLTLIGRAPQSDNPQTQIIRVQSPNQDISRTHLSVRPAAGGIELTDEHSTNGTIITMPDGNRYSLTPGSATFVQAGTRIDLGDGQVLELLTQ